MLSACLLGLVASALLFEAVALERPTRPSVAGLATVYQQGPSTLAPGAGGAASSAPQAAFGVTGAAGTGLDATNGPQHLRIHFSKSGVRVGMGAAHMGLSLRGVGYGSSLQSLRAVSPVAMGDAVAYVREGLSEWYRNGPLGLEQGFTILRAPAAVARGPLTLEMSLSGNLRAVPDPGGQSVTLTEAGGPALRYGSLQVRDARGRPLHGWFGVRGGMLLLHVETRGALYPLAIDPFIQSGGKMTGAGEVGNGSFGASVALSANASTAVVGAPGDAGGAGAVFVYERLGEEWVQQAKLTGPGELGAGRFGAAVALSADGSTALVGAPGDNAGAGAAWLFTPTEGVWTAEGEKLTGAGESGAAQLGSSVALTPDATTALVGGPGDNAGIGAAWAYVRSGGVWTPQGEKLTGLDELGAARFGSAVALSSDGNTALIGAPRDNPLLGGGGYFGAAWGVERSGGAWSQQTKLAPQTAIGGNPEIGTSVALSGDGNTALLGDTDDEGYPYWYGRTGTSWSQEWPENEAFPKTGAGYETHFGASLALTPDGYAAIVGGPGDNGGAGAGWGYTRLQVSAEVPWKQLGSKFSPSGEIGAGHFASSIGLSAAGNTALIGAPGDNGNLGAVWTFVDSPPRPLLESVTPGVGSCGGGTAVTITGTGFTGATGVTFWPTPVKEFTVNSDNSITAISPPGMGLTSISVTTPGGTTPPTPADQFTYGPCVTRVSPNSGPPAGGTSVAIAGVGLTGATAVHFGAAEATSFTDNGGSISAVSPPGVGTVDITVTTALGVSSPMPADRFSYVPIVTSVKPPVGPGAGGTSVSIGGSNFTGASSVWFGATPAASFSVTSNTLITAVSPPGTGTVDVTVDNAAGSSLTGTADLFTYREGPEFGRCVAARKGYGQYGNPNCTVLGGERRSEWYPAVGGSSPLYRPRFTTRLKELSTQLQTVGGQTVSCTGESGRGEYVGPRTVNTTLGLTGCHLGTGAGCHSGGAAEGEVASSNLVGELGVIAKSSVTALKNKVGIDLRPASGEVFAAFACGATPALVTGSGIAELQRNTMLVNATVRFAARKGIQKPTAFEGAGEDVLFTKLGEGGVFERSGLSLVLIQSNEEKVEVNSVF